MKNFPVIVFALGCVSGAGQLFFIFGRALSVNAVSEMVGIALGYTGMGLIVVWIAKKFGSENRRPYFSALIVLGFMTFGSYFGAIKEMERKREAAFSQEAHTTWERPATETYGNTSPSYGGASGEVKSELEDYLFQLARSVRARSVAEGIFVLGAEAHGTTLQYIIKTTFQVTTSFREGIVNSICSTGTGADGVRRLLERGVTIEHILQNDDRSRISITKVSAADCAFR